MVEGDLAFRNVDLRELFLPGAALTWRRLMSLIRSLPYESATQTALRVAQEKALKPTVEDIRARQAYYQQRAEGA